MAEKLNRVRRRTGNEKCGTKEVMEVHSKKEVSK